MNKRFRWLSLLLVLVIVSVRIAHAQQTSAAGGWMYVSNDVPSACTGLNPIPVYPSSGYYNIWQYGPVYTILVGTNGVNYCHAYLNVESPPDKIYIVEWADGSQTTYNEPQSFGYNNENGDPTAESYNVPVGIMFTGNTISVPPPTAVVLTAKVSGTRSAILSWPTLVAPGAYVSADTYTQPRVDIFRSKNPATLAGEGLDPANAIAEVTGGSTSYTDTSLASNTTYYYAITYTWYENNITSETSGLWSPPSNVAKVTTPIPVPLTLTSVSPTSGPGGTTITLAGTGLAMTASNRIWFHDPDPATTTDFYVYGVLSANGTTMTLKVPSTLLSGHVYDVSDSIDAGNTWSDPVLFQVSSPGAPSSLTATLTIDPAKQGVDLKWINNDAKATSILLERDNSTSTPSFSQLAVLEPTATSYLDDFSDSGNSSTLLNSETYRLRAENDPDGDAGTATYTGYSNTANIDNCVSISGGGPEKIVFMRGNEWKGTTADFMADAQAIITNGFQSIDPFKTFMGEFSFYLDLQNVDETKLNNSQNMLYGKTYNFITDIQKLKAGSSCGSEGFEYFFLFGDPDGYDGYSVAESGMVFMDVGIAPIVYDPTLSPQLNLGLLAMHESGHALGGLEDEYVKEDQAGELSDEPGFSGEASTSGLVDTYSNCSTDPNADYRSSKDGLLYGSVSTPGCSYFYNSGESTYYKPASASIMQFAESGYAPKFNVISCGYLIAAFHDQPIDKAYAQGYWPLCTQLDTVDGKAITASHTNNCPLGYTCTPSPTESPTPTPVPTPTAGLTATSPTSITPYIETTPVSSVPIYSPTVTPTPSVTPTSSPTPSPTSSPKASPSPSSTPKPTASPSPSPAAFAVPQDESAAAILSNWWNSIGNLIKSI